LSDQCVTPVGDCWSLILAFVWSWIVLEVIDCNLVIVHVGWRQLMLCEMALMCYKKQAYN